MADTGSAVVRVDRRMYLTEDRERAVPPGDPEARFLLCVPGSDMLRSDAVRYGLLDTPAAEREAGSDQEPEPEPSTPKRGRRPADKSRTAVEDK